MTTKKISILGSTGSVGLNTLKVIRSLGKNYRVVGLSAQKNIQQLESQIKEFQPQAVSVEDEQSADSLRRIINLEHLALKIYSGPEGMTKIATLSQSNMVVSCVVGAAGLLPLLAAIRSGKQIALANKEALVMAGELIMKEASQNKIKILPLDSEHSAIFQCLQGEDKNRIQRLILTASGGPFYKFSREKLAKVTIQQTLHHPIWAMGKKISVDSATLMNKGLEVIEARHLFDVAYEKIAVLIHPQSIVHSLVEYVDGSVKAQLSLPDMYLPVQYALTYPTRERSRLPRLYLEKIKHLDFESPSMDKFPGLKVAWQAGVKGGTAPAVLNAANEVAVEAFLAGRINFLEIPKIVKEVIGQHCWIAEPKLENILAADSWAREKAKEVAGTPLLQRGEN